jgi:hypothetical protein
LDDGEIGSVGVALGSSLRNDPSTRVHVFISDYGEIGLIDEMIIKYVGI